MEATETKQKKPLLKFKHVIVIIIAGLLLTRIGAMLKLNSDPLGGMFLTIGLLVQVLGYVLAIIKLLSFKEVRYFLNS